MANWTAFTSDNCTSNILLIFCIYFKLYFLMFYISAPKVPNRPAPPPPKVNKPL